MPKATSTLIAIDQATLRLADKDERRKHLGASIIGDRCARKVFYKFRWAYDGQPHPPQLLRLFKRGHREEPELIALLREAGVTVFAAGESGELKERLRISDVDGHFGGTPDGIGVGVPDCPEEEPVLLEFKTMNESQFKKTKEDGVMTAHWEYFIQMQIYMEKHNLSCALFIAACKNDDELYAEIVQANKPQADHYISRARDIIYADSPPPRIADSIAKYPCKWCDFKYICHTSDFPAINCRTCCHVSVGPAGTWTCARGHTSEVADQRGCTEHIYDPRWFDGWSVLGGDFEGNWININNGVETFSLGGENSNNQAAYTSRWLLKNGLAPF